MFIMDIIAVKKFYTLDELHSEIFQGKISKAHIYNLVARGEIKSIKFGTRILIPSTYVDGLFETAK